MVETFYVHLEFIGKDGKASWSVNLPFLCARCGKCCTLENFLTAGKTDDPQNTRPEVHVKFKALTEELGKLFDQDEAKYNQHIANNLCPFLADDNSCAIYEIRPEGCRLFPGTRFGMTSTDCEALNRFKKQKVALKKGRRCTETYCRIRTGLSELAGLVESSEHNRKQLEVCVAKLQQVGMTDNELTLFLCFNSCE